MAEEMAKLGRSPSNMDTNEGDVEAAPQFKGRKTTLVKPLYDEANLKKSNEIVTDILRQVARRGEEPDIQSIPEDVWNAGLKRVEENPNLKAQSELIEGMRGNLKNLEKMPGGLNLKPVAGFFDQWTGGDLAKNISAPMTPEDRQEMLIKLKGGTAKAYSEQQDDRMKLLKDTFLQKKGGGSDLSTQMGLANLLSKPTGGTLTQQDIVPSASSLKEPNTEKLEKLLTPVLDAQSAVVALQNLMNKYPTGKLPGVGPAEGKTPKFLVAPGESLGLLDAGATEMRDALTNVVNIANKELSGMRATDKDFDRAKSGIQLIESGIEENMRKGASILLSVLKNRERSKRASGTDKQIQAWDKRLEREGYVKPEVTQSAPVKKEYKIGDKQVHPTTGKVRIMTERGWVVQ